ncbi:UxaA family hydrolase [Caproicibacter fermentans]|uniref:Altronate dehydratase n=1 Tax=Caproicibacter fermentans TaxID=2576756 RepID=A0A7G8TEC4_9FIRM|nr:altronate dehydratase family protein [Caproicibacter fermentans]QNK41965.1 altronate dehydratase [Caproicibacter fermentans]
MNKAIKINDKDNVAVALCDLKKGEPVELGGKIITLVETIARGHKFALSDLSADSEIIKYGFPIGRAKQNIPRGAWVHSHNMATGLNAAADEYRYRKTPLPADVPNRNLTFDGFRRADGSAGIRNELWIVPTVGCINGTAELIVRRFREKHSPAHAEAIRILKHNYGCSQLGDDLSATRRLLADFTRHPNAGGVLILSLGCESNTPESFRQELGSFDESRVRFLVAQETDDEIERGADLLAELNDRMAGDRREPIPLTELRVGMKCGGSDGLSGITANPLIGRFTDFLVSQGGTVILTEVPEMFGAETILMNRARDSGVFQKAVGLIRNFKKYFTDAGQPVYENPSPGNKAGGITTLEEKSLGCIQKGGSAEVEDVLPYAGRITQKGLNLLCAPGNDLVSASALAAAGCQMVLFSTGRGTPFGTVVPTIKISTNTQLSERKPRWIDFDAGPIAAGKKADDLCGDLTRLVLQTASGQQTCSEKYDFAEIAVWKNGVTL